MVFISEECRRNYVILSYWLFFSSVFFTFFRLTWYKLLTILVDKLVTDDDCDITYRSCSFHDLINHFHWISEAGGDILKIVQSISSISDAVIRVMFDLKCSASLGFIFLASNTTSYPGYSRDAATDQSGNWSENDNFFLLFQLKKK